MSTTHVPLDLAVVAGPMASCFNQEDERYRMTLEALADVDAGRMIDHAAVQAWADSLGTKTPLPSPIDGA